MTCSALRKSGPPAYGDEQREKAELLRRLLADFNDGRKKAGFKLQKKPAKR